MKVLILNGSPRKDGNTSIALNMTFLMRCIELGKEKYGLPETEVHAWTHFIR